MNGLLVLHSVASADLEEWRELAGSYVTTLNIRHDDGNVFSLSLFADTPFDIQREAHGASEEIPHE